MSETKKKFKIRIGNKSINNLSVDDCEGIRFQEITPIGYTNTVASLHMEMLESVASENSSFESDIYEFNNGYDDDMDYIRTRFYGRGNAYSTINIPCAGNCGENIIIRFYPNKVTDCKGQHSVDPTKPSYCQHCVDEVCIKKIGEWTKAELCELKKKREEEGYFND